MLDLLREAGIELVGETFSLPYNIKRVKIDVGLSVNAPQSQNWLTQDPDFFVFGFEPLSGNCESVRNGLSNYGVKLNPKFLASRMSIIQAALYSSNSPSFLKMFVTSEDPGCSSLLQPKEFEVSNQEWVKVTTLNDFFSFFPFDDIPFIDHVKVDAQGADFEILKGANNYLDRIFAITTEIDTSGNLKTTNSKEGVRSFMAKNNFIEFSGGHKTNLVNFLKGFKIDIETDDATFINKDLLRFAKSRRFHLYQRG